ncbi:adenine deaminase [Clostridiaceae bacterium HFYG-1003]|nr:adenine deaminase [Clostridiaceae bacterium HFYG-1003]
MDYRTLLEASAGRVRADLVLKNAYLLDVFNAQFFQADLAIAHGRIAGIGDYEGVTELDCSGRWIVPAFLDGHMHIESAMVTPGQYARGVLPHGVTTVMADPHEIANVLGEAGVRWLMDASRGLPLDFRFMIPSCVPAAPIDHAGSELTAEQMSRLKTHEAAHGLGEMMDFPALLQGSEAIAQKLAAFSDRPRDGHAPGITGKALNAYVGSGIQTEHECSTREEMEERIRLGMYIQIREGTAAKNALALLPAVNDHNWRRCFFCTDDIEPFDILRDGTIDHLIRLAIRHGIDPARAYAMASFNSAQAYRLEDRGALAPGRRADFLILDDLADVSIEAVYAGGRLVCRQGQITDFDLPLLDRPDPSVRFQPLTEESLHLTGTTYRALVMSPGSLVTGLKQGRIESENFPYGQAMAKLVSLERHRALPLAGVCALDGFGIQKGAIASTIAHDAHNLICAGASDADILRAIERVGEISGGIVLVENGQVLAELELPIAGLLTEAPIEEVAGRLEEMDRIAHQVLGIPEAMNPFLSLAFMALPVIPEVKLTVEGLFSVTEQRLLPAVE